MILGCQSSIIHTKVDIHIDIHAAIFIWKDILKLISVTNKRPRIDIHIFMDIRLQSYMLLWISIWISLDFLH